MAIKPPASRVQPLASPRANPKSHFLSVIALVALLCCPMAIEAAGLPKRPAAPPKSAPQSEALDGTQQFFLLDMSRLEQAKPTPEFQTQAGRALVDPVTAVYYRREGGLSGGSRRERGGECFVMTWADNIKPDSDFGKDVQRRIAGPLAAKTRLICTTSDAGTWRGIAWGEGVPPAPVANAFQAMLKDPARTDWPPKDPPSFAGAPHPGLYYAAKAMPKNRWAVVVGDVNAGMWIWEATSQLTDANALRLVAGAKSKSSSVSIQQAWDGNTAVYDDKAICPALLVADRSGRALGGAAKPAPEKKPKKEKESATGKEASSTSSLDYHTLTDVQSREYTERARMVGATADATGFLFGNLYDNTTNTIILNDSEIAQLRAVGKKYVHAEMIQEDKRVGLLKDSIQAIGEEKIRKIGITIFVAGKAKYAWPAPAPKESSSK